MVWSGALEVRGFPPPAVGQTPSACPRKENGAEVSSWYGLERLGFEVSHPFAKNANGWGTLGQIYFPG